MPPPIVAALIVLCEALTFTLTLPVLNFFNTQLGGEAAFLGILFALVSAPKIFTNPLFGRLSDRIGRRPILAINTVGTFVGSLLWALSGDLLMLAASRAVIGIFSAQAGLAQSVVADSTTRERRASAMGLLGAAFGVALAVGPFVGGWIAGSFGYAAVGWACAALQLTSLGLITLALRETRPPAHASHAAHSLSDEFPREVLRNPRVWRLLAVLVLLNAGTNAVLATLGLHVGTRFGYGPERAGAVFGVMGVVAILVQGGLIRPCVRRFGEIGTVATGVVLAGVGFGLMIPPWPSPGFWTGLVVSSIGVGLIGPCLSALITHAVADHQQGGVAGWQQSALAVGRSIGNIAGGSSFAAVGPAGPPALAVTLGLIALPGLLALRRWMRSERDTGR
ncbi:MAG: MFS transporter [Phycisphaerales bacterium]|nr:MFS transporter [Phycisphaerales bacterium]